MQETLAELYVGADGCRAGWAAALLQPALRSVRLWMVPSFRQVIDDIPAGVEIWVDIPIGLTGSGVTRRLDEAMRAALKARKSSVFPAPCRAALAAQTYPQARELEQLHQARSLSAQAYHLIPKIREVDELLQNQPAWRARVLESHPELCFQRLNGDQPLRHSKKYPAGWQERAELLECYLKGSREAALDLLANTRRAQVQPDDVLDALVLAVAAWLNRGEEGGYLRQKESQDAAGIPLRIACPPLLRCGETA